MFTGRWSSSSATRASARGARPSAPALNTAFNVATTTTTTNTTPSIDTNTNTNSGNTKPTATATSTPTPPTSSPLPPLSSPVTSALSVSSPRTPRNSGGPGFPAFLFFSGGGGGTAGNRKSADSWNSWNSSNRGAAEEQREWEWKSDQMLLLLRTLDALPSHLLTPFNGPVPPSNLLDKIARGVAQAKGPEEWPHSVRATRTKLAELARTRAENERNPAVAGGGKTRQRRRILEAEGEVDEYVAEVLQPTTNLASSHGHQNQHHQHHYQQNHNHNHHHHNGHDTRSGSNANTRRPLQQRQQTTAPAANRGDAMHLDRPDIRITESTNRRLQPSHLPASLSPLSSRPLNAVSTPSSSTLHSSSSSTALSVSSSASTSTFEDGTAAGRRPKSLRRCVSSVLAHAHGGNNNNNINTSTSSLSSSASASSREAMCVPAELLRPPPAIMETRAKTVPATPGAASAHHAQPTARVLRRAESFCAPSLSTMAAGGGGGSIWKKQSFKRAPTYGVVAGVYREAAEKIEAAAAAAAAAAVPRRGAGAGHAGAGAGGDAETEAAALALAACGCPSSDEEERERLWTVKKVRRTKHASAPPAVRTGGGHRYDHGYDGRDEEEDEARMAVDGAAAVPASPVKPRTRKTSGPTARARTTSAPTAVGAGLVARKGKRVVQRNAGIFDAELPPLPPLPPQHQHQHQHQYRQQQQQQQQQQRQQQQQQQQPQAMRMAPPGLPAVVECSATSCASPSSPVATPPLTPTCTCPTTAASAMARKLRRIRATSFARDPARRISFGSLPAPASASASGGDGSGVLAGGAGFGGGAGGAGGGVEDAEMGAVGTTEEFEHAGPTLLGGCAGLESAFQLQ